MRQRTALLVVAVAVACAIAPGMAVATTGDSPAQIQDPTADATVENLAFTNVTTSFTVDEMTLTAPNVDVTVENASVEMLNGSMNVSEARHEDGSLTIVESTMSVERATIEAETATITSEGRSVTVTDETVTLENESVTIEDRTLSEVLGGIGSVGPFTIEDVSARDILEDGTIDSMTIRNVSGSLEVEQMDLGELTTTEGTVSGFANFVDIAVRNGSLTVEDVAVEDGQLMVGSGMVHVDDGDAFVATLNFDVEDGREVTMINEVFAVEDRTFEVSDVELTREELLDLIFGTGGM